MVSVMTTPPAPSMAGLGLDQACRGVKVGGLVRDQMGPGTVLGSPLLLNVKLEKETHKPVPTSKAAVTPLIAQCGSANIPRAPVYAMHAGASRAPEESIPDS